MNKQCDVILTYCWNRVGYTILRDCREMPNNYAIS